MKNKERNVKCFGDITLMILIILVLVPGGMVLAQVQKNTALNAPVQTTETGSIKWYTPEEAYEKNKISPKPFFIDVYTDWCGWCKRMDATTFKDPVIAQYLNNNFYPVKLDAETKDTVNFMDRSYVNSQAIYVSKYLVAQDSIIKVLNDSMKLLAIDTTKLVEVQGVASRIQDAVANKNQMARNGRRTSHDFARDLMNNQMSYPTFVLLFDSLKQNFPLKGYQKPEQLLSTLSFFAEKVYQQTTDLQGYNTLFNEVTNIVAENNSFLSVEHAEMAAKTNNKKTIILLTKEDLYTSLLMEKGVFVAPEITTILNQDFNVAQMSVFSKDTIEFQGTSFSNQRGYHDLALALTKNQIKFPCVAVLDEQQRLIMPIPGFFLPSEFVVVLNFLKEDAYKTVTYLDFKKEFLNR